MPTYAQFQDATPLLNEAEALRQSMNTDGSSIFTG
jgi:hypothetical protein